MPSQSWLIAAPDPSSPETLPVYTKDGKPPAYGHNKKLSTIMEVNEDDETRLARSSWEFARFLSLEHAAMVPQALLVDASTTLCAYLYFTSLQARMIIQQQASLEILQTVCTAVPSDSGSPLVGVCGQALAHQQTFNLSMLPPFVSQYMVITIVALKALLGYSLFKVAGKYVKPFDYLVASGAAHCLLLYCFLFVPVANMVESISLVDANVWLQIATKFFWLVIIASAITFVHCIISSCNADRQAIALPADDVSDAKDVEATAA